MARKKLVVPSFFQLYLEECALLDCMEKSTNPKGLTNKERLNAYSFDNQLKEAQFAREPQKEQQKFVREFWRQQAETSELKLAEARK